ncbi:MAG: hypothetical protein LAO18_12500 [Acidobacteriia bacterium]|jgi:hypothetical protein|nr:hypothetical protein [Terriglobia bacterium]
MAFRRVLFWVHLTAGCVAGLVILVMSVTGALLAYRRFYPSLYLVRLLFVFQLRPLLQCLAL